MNRNGETDVLLSQLSIQLNCEYDHGQLVKKEYKSRVEGIRWSFYVSLTIFIFVGLLGLGWGGYITHIIIALILHTINWQLSQFTHKSNEKRIENKIYYKMDSNITYR